MFIASAFYADNSLPITVLKNGTASSHHQPVNTNATTTITHAVHQLKQNEQRIISPILSGACICTHKDMVHDSLTSNLFTKHHTHADRHPVKTEATSTQPIKPITPIISLSPFVS
ncbi:MAG: hypothetical protein J5799_04720 [Bacteroidales bacterium]|nr:hypothetical protein [Bacteroidales bacterium]